MKYFHCMLLCLSLEAVAASRLPMQNSLPSTMDDPLLADTFRQDDTPLDPVSTPSFPDEATAASNSGLLPPLAHPEPPAPSASPLDPPESGMDHAANDNDSGNDNCDCGDNDLAQDDPDCLCDDQDEPPCTVLTSIITRPSNNTATLVPNTTTTTTTVPHDADNPSYNSTPSQTLTLSYPPISCKPHKVTTRETLITSTPTTTRTRTIMHTSLHRVSYLVTPSPVDWRGCLESLLSNCTTTPTSPPPPPATETSTVYVPKPFYKPVYIPLKQSSSSCTPATTTLSRRFIYSTRTSMVISTVSNANASASSHPTNTPTPTSTHAPAPAPATVTTTATMTAAPIAAAPVAAAAPVFMQPPPMPQYVMAQQQPILMPAQAAAAPIAAAAPVAVSTATATTTSTATQTTTSTATQIQSPVYAVESYAVEEAAVATTTATTTGATPTSPSMFSAATYTATGWPAASTDYGAMMGITTTISGGLNSYMYAVYTSTIFNP